MQPLPRVKIPTSTLPPETGNGTESNTSAKGNDPADSSVEIPDFYKGILRNFSRPGKHAAGHAGSMEGRVVRRRKKSKVERASRRRNRP